MNVIGTTNIAVNGVEVFMVRDTQLILFDGGSVELLSEEWNVVCDALNVAYIEGEFWQQDFAEDMHETIQDMGHFEGLGKKWGCNTRALAVKIKAMTVAEKLAIIETASNWLNITSQIIPKP